MNTINDTSSVFSDVGLKREEEIKPVKDNRLDQEDFLALLTEQLRNQDPLEPMGNTDFVAQMAQFSTVDGVTELNKSFAQLSASINSNQALQASSLVGRNVLVKSDVGVLGQQSALRGTFELQNSTPGVLISVENEQGQLVRTIELQEHQAGAVDFAWDGTTNQGARLPPGRYKVNVQAIQGGQHQAVPVKIFGHVSSVTIGKGENGLSLNLTGLGGVPFDEIERIE